MDFIIKSGQASYPFSSSLVHQQQKQQKQKQRRSLIRRRRSRRVTLIKSFIISPSTTKTLFCLLLLLTFLTSLIPIATSLSNNMNYPTTPKTSTTTTSSSSSSLRLLTLGGTKLRSLVQEAAINKESSMDLQGIYWMEHINLVVGSNDVAKKFYLDLLGFTRDEGKSFHVNLGQQQFHLADLTKSKGQPTQTIAGSIGLTVPNLNLVKQRLIDNGDDGIGYEICSDTDQCFTVRGPYGNIFHLYDINDDDSTSTTKYYKALDTPQKMTNMHSLGGSYGRNRMSIRGQPGIRYVEIACPQSSSSKIAKFYRELLGCSVQETNPDNNNQKCAIVSVGPGVHLVFVEQQCNNNNEEENESSSILLLKDAYKAMEGVHICFYVNNFKELYERLNERNLIWTNPRFTHLDSCDTWEEARLSHTLRFKDVIDIDTNEKILELEHETRPLIHGQYLKVPKYIPN